MAAKRAPGEPSWFWRRSVLFAMNGYCMIVLWKLIDAPDTEVNEVIAWGHILLLMAQNLGYQGFATAQDAIAIMATKSGTPYAPPAPAQNEVAG